MGDVINLRLARKAAARAKAEATAAANRAAHGATKGERATTRAERDRLAKAQDGAKRDHGAPGAES